MILEPIGMKEKDYVMIPVNDNEENSIGGSHWYESFIYFFSSRTVYVFNPLSARIFALNFTSYLMASGYKRIAYESQRFLVASRYPLNVFFLIQ